MSTLIKIKCVAKKEVSNWSFKQTEPEDRVSNNKKATEVELEVPYDTTSIFHKLSGGTNFILRTVNQDAADQFELGNSYDVVISPSVD